MRPREFIRPVGGVAAALPLAVRTGRMIQIQVDDLKCMTNVNLYSRKDAKNNDLYDTFFEALQQQSIGGK